MRSIVLKAFIVLLSYEATLALPRPDFGIAQTVQSSSAIADRARVIHADFDALNNISANPGNQQLNQVRDILISISGKISNTGMTLMDTIVTLASDKAGPVSVVFDRVNQAIASLNALLNGGLNSELNTLTSRLGPSAADELKGDFGIITAGLKTLSTALANLQVGITKAQQAAGTGPVTVSHVRMFVPFTLGSNVLTALNNIRAYLPLVNYHINNPSG